MDTQHSKQPGDLILDRYMANATEEEREVARENLREFAQVIVAIEERLLREKREQARETLAELKKMI